MKVNTTNCPDICSIVIASSSRIVRLRPTSLQVFRSTGVPFKPAGRRTSSNRKLTQPSAPIAP